MLQRRTDRLIDSCRSAADRRDGGMPAIATRADGAHLQLSPPARPPAVLDAMALPRLPTHVRGLPPRDPAPNQPDRTNWRRAPGTADGWPTIPVTREEVGRPPLPGSRRTAPMSLTEIGPPPPVRSQRARARIRRSIRNAEIARQGAEMPRSLPSVAPNENERRA